ncbi:MAG: BatD family protein [Bacteroidota bacterium]|nr:BatD family protein [Bacteroidota bacterium]
MKKNVLIILLLLCIGKVFGQVEFKAELSRDKIGLNEHVRIDFVMNQDGDNLEIAPFDGFKVVGGPYQQISSSYINGKKSFRKSFGYTLQPTRKGVLMVGKAKITINGQVYETQPQKLTVTEAVNRPNDTSELMVEADESIFFVAQVSKTNPYLNEPISVVYKVYYNPQIGVSNPITNAIPEFKDFWSQDINSKNNQPNKEIYKGKEYYSVVIKEVILYPQKVEKLQITPYTITVNTKLPTNKRSFYGTRVYRDVERKISTATIDINVKPLPEQGKPVDFNGAVGEFDFVTTTDRTALRQGESVQMNISVEGRGNFELFALPKPLTSSGLEVYEPKVLKDTYVTSQGIKGKITNKYTIIPQFQGKYIIKPISFSYFNPKTQQYHTIESSEFVIDMIDGPINNLSSDNQSMVNTQDLEQKQVKKDQFEGIQDTASWLSVQSDDFLFSKRFIFWLLLPLFLIPILVFLHKQKQALNQKQANNKNTIHSGKLAKKYLQEAKQNIHNKQTFYQALEKGLHNFLKAKLKVETSEMNKDKIKEMLTNKGIEQDIIQMTIEVIENAELNRYAPSMSDTVEADYDKVIKIINRIK